MSQSPSVSATGAARIALSGRWTLNQAADLDAASATLVSAGRGRAALVFDLGQVEAMDTAGALLVNRARSRLAAAGAAVTLEGAHAEHATLLGATPYTAPEPPAASPNFVVAMLEDVGASASHAAWDLTKGLGFLGRIVATFAGQLSRPKRWRPTSMVYHLEKYSWRSAPIIILINFLVGGIIAQQGLFQLNRFGAPEFVVDLIGVLVLRELGVLLTSIMVAGRVGAAITAEIGTMKMREEVDALTVMALDPTETLVMPRVLALIVALPLLTFLADMAAILGGMLVAAVYGGVTPDVFLFRLQGAIGLNTFLVGLLKAPVMALVIGLIATGEGFAVGGSAESLGLKVTETVVKAIFMVIVVDGIFAMLFAAVRY